jgi:hypothetical protein
MIQVYEVPLYGEAVVIKNDLRLVYGNSNEGEHPIGVITEINEEECFMEIFLFDAMDIRPTGSKVIKEKVTREEGGEYMHKALSRAPYDMQLAFIMEDRWNDAFVKYGWSGRFTTY